jgi:hypothetical protein
MNYTQELKLKHNEVAAKIDKETGEIKEVNKRPNNFPKGTGVHVMEDFFKMNTSLVLRLKGTKILSMEEIGIITYMAAVSEFNTNSLKPLNNDTTVLELVDIFGIGKNRVNKVLDRLYRLGVYLQIKIYENSDKEYWVLNPNISWKGRTIKDSMFSHFKNTTISKLLM